MINMFSYSSHTSSLPIFFFFNDTATTEIYTLSLPDALPILRVTIPVNPFWAAVVIVEVADWPAFVPAGLEQTRANRSEEHTSELQSQSNLVCRLLLEKKKEPNYSSSVKPTRNSVTVAGSVTL